jgi:hypothetical protein
MVRQRVLSSEGAWRAVSRTTCVYRTSCPTRGSIIRLKHQPWARERHSPVCARAWLRGRGSGPGPGPPPARPSGAREEGRGLHHVRVIHAHVRKWREEEGQGSKGPAINHASISQRASATERSSHSNSQHPQTIREPSSAACARAAPRLPSRRRGSCRPRPAPRCPAPSTAQWRCPPAHAHVYGARHKHTCPHVRVPKTRAWRKSTTPRHASSAGAVVCRRQGAAAAAAAAPAAAAAAAAAVCSVRCDSPCHRRTARRRRTRRCAAWCPP